MPGGTLNVVEMPPKARLIAVEVGVLVEEQPPYVLISLSPGELWPVIVYADHRGDERRCDYEMLVPTCEDA